MKRFIAFIVRHRWPVIVASVIVTVALAAQLRHMTVVIDPSKILPQEHPYVRNGQIIEQVFGAKNTVLVAVTAKTGDVLNQHMLAKVKALTSEIMHADGVIRSSVMSVASRKAKIVAGTEVGLEVFPLMEQVPTDSTGMKQLREALKSNPVFSGMIVSQDFRTLVVVAEFSDGKHGYQQIDSTVRAIANKYEDSSVDIIVGGQPSFLSLMERYSSRMKFLFPLALLLIGLIHFEAFRTWQGLLLPLVTALLAVIWALGIMSSLSIPLDVINVTTPLLILAVAAGHAVQILKRFYEELYDLQKQTRPLNSDLRHLAVIESMSKIGPVMLAAGTIAALSFLSLAVFSIRSIQTFGILTALGISSTMIIELTVIPAVRSLMKLPSAFESRRERAVTFWDRTAATLSKLVTGSGRRWLLATSVALLLVAFAGILQVRIDNRLKGNFSSALSVSREDDLLNARLAGTNTMYLLIDGNEPDAIKRPDVLRAMEKAQEHLRTYSFVGQSVSIVDVIKQLNRATHADSISAFAVPQSQELVAQYLLLYGSSGEPADLDSYVDDNYSRAVVKIFLKTQSSAELTALSHDLVAFCNKTFPPDVTVGLGGGVMNGVAMNEVIVREKLLNILQVGLVVLVISALLFRSLTAGLFVLIPLAMAVAINFGVMGLFDIALQMGTATISAMAIGMGADYAIYFLYRIREELQQGRPESVAIHNTFLSAGKGVMFVASAVGCGYAVLMLSPGFKPHLWLGSLISLAMFSSALATLTIFPALLLKLRPRFLFRHASAPSRSDTRKQVATLIVLVTTLVVASTAAATDANSIMQRNFEVGQVPQSISKVEIRLINEQGRERIRRTESITKQQRNRVDNYRLTRFEYPADVKGTATLIHEQAKGNDDIWVYLPALGKVRRLASANKKESFAGTDFSYADIIGFRVDEWDYRVLRFEQLENRDCVVIEALPKDSAIVSTTGYSMRVLWIDTAMAITLRSDAYDGTGTLLRHARFSDFRQVGSAPVLWRPMVLEAENVQTRHRTVVTISDYRTDVAVDERLFDPTELDQE